LSQDIFKFWAEIRDDAHEHPADEAVLRRIKHGFHPKCLPAAYSGNLRNAPVVLLFLSPGLDSGDVRHCASKKGRNYYALQRPGEGKLPTKDEHPSAYKWLRKILGQFDIKSDDDYELARTTIATLNIGAYKSKSYKDWGMLAALPSSRASLDWAQSVLFTQAENNERVVVCLRSPRHWGLGGKTKGSLFCPPCTRGAFMKKKGKMRKIVKAAVQKAMATGKRTRSK